MMTWPEVKDALAAVDSVGQPVRFTVKAGEVADLGSLLVAKAWEPSPLPELAGEVDLGRSAVMDYGLFAVGLRPRHRARNHERRAGRDRVELLKSGASSD